MECPSCSYVATPGEAAVQGACPNCQRPYMNQPSPTQSDMAMRDMPEPGMDDSGGNPLQEGILGDYQNRGVRDESYASVQHQEDNEEPDFEITGVLPPDADSLRPGKKRMDKQADFWSDVGDVAAPLAGGTAGFLVGGPAGAAIGAGLAGGGMSALEGGNAGDVIGTGVADAAMGGIGGGVAGAGLKGAEALGSGAAMAGSADEAAAAGSTRGGVGSLMKSALGKASPYLKGAYWGNQGMNTLDQATPSAGGTTAPAPIQPPSYYSRTAAPNSTPSSQDHIPSNDTSDPEDVDFHERNDGDDKGLAGEQDINDIGGTDTGPDGLFSADSPALKSLADLLPKVLQFALSDDPGQGDPDLDQLHQQIEQEHPGYLNDANDEHGHKLIMMVMNSKPGEQGGDTGDDLLQDNDAPHDPIAEHQATALRPGLDTACGLCGSVVDPSSGNCPQCGKQNIFHQPQPTNPDLTTPQQMAVAKTAADTQGPHTPEQMAMVAQLLQQQGRGDEVPDMILNPFNYADELSQITGQENPPQDMGQDGPPPPVDPSQQGQMPMPGMSAPPAGGAGPGAGPMMSAISKYAATVDSVAGPCPKCKGHSTGYTDVEDGKCGCKTCGHSWKADGLVQNKEAAGHDETLADQNPIAAPMADVEQPDDPSQEQDSSHTWVDADGLPLKVGQSYEMYSSNYQIPDRIRIDKVKPDVINYTLVGEYGMSAGSELTHEEASVEGTSFVPSHNDEGSPDGQGDLEQNQDDPTQRSDPGQVSDLSTPHMQMASVESSEETGPEWLKEDNDVDNFHTAGQKFTPYQQRDFIDEDGVARNADKLNLSGTHYETSDIADHFLW